MFPGVDFENKITICEKVLEVPKVPKVGNDFDNKKIHPKVPGLY